MKIHNPSTVAAPIGQYSHGIEVASGSRTLYVAGQVGIDSDGNVVDSVDGQCRATWENISNILVSADMKLSDIVSLRTYLVENDHFPAYREVRGEFLGNHAPSSTLLIVKALVLPELLVEIDCVAVRA